MKLRTMHKRRKRRLNRKTFYQGKIVSFQITSKNFSFVMDRKSNDEIVSIRRSYSRASLNFDLSAEACSNLFLRLFGKSTETIEDVVEEKNVFRHRWFADILDAEILDE